MKKLITTAILALLFASCGKDGASGANGLNGQDGLDHYSYLINVDVNSGNTVTVSEGSYFVMPTLERVTASISGICTWSDNTAVLVFETASGTNRLTFQADGNNSNFTRVSGSVGTTFRGGDISIYFERLPTKLCAGVSTQVAPSVSFDLRIIEKLVIQ